MRAKVIRLIRAIKASKKAQMEKSVTKARIKAGEIAPLEYDHASARSIANVNQKRGKIIPQPCEVCKTTEGVQKHHSDYRYPKHVTWLCKRHHKEMDKLLAQADKRAKSLIQSSKPQNSSPTNEVRSPYHRVRATPIAKDMSASPDASVGDNAVKPSKSRWVQAQNDDGYFYVPESALDAFEALNLMDSSTDCSPDIGSSDSGSCDGGGGSSD